MKSEDQCAEVVQASALVFKVFRECQAKTSVGGEKITVEEYADNIFPKIRVLMDQAWKLYVYSLEEHSKEAKVLMHKCMTCSKYNENTCKVFNDMGDHITWDKFQLFVTKFNSLCIEGVDNNFYMPDGVKYEK